MFVIGHGRYARAVYPQPRGGGGPPPASSPVKLVQSASFNPLPPIICPQNSSTPLVSIVIPCPVDANQIYVQASLIWEGNVVTGPLRGAAQLFAAANMAWATVFDGTGPVNCDTPVSPALGNGRCEFSGYGIGVFGQNTQLNFLFNVSPGNLGDSLAVLGYRYTAFVYQ